MDVNLNPENIPDIRQEIYHDILMSFNGAITIAELEQMSMDELENLMAARAGQTISEMRDRISVFNDLTGNLNENDEEKLLEHIFMNRLQDFNIFYQFITIFLSACITSDRYQVLPAYLKADYDNKHIEYRIEILGDADHKAVVSYFEQNSKFEFKNFDYDIRYSQNNKIVSIEFIQL